MKFPKEYGLSRGEEIRSHSSLLTNERLDKIFQNIDFWQIEAWKRPCVPNIQSYYASLKTLYTNIYVLLSEEELLKMENWFGEYLKIFNSLYKSENQTLDTMFNLLVRCDRINMFMKRILQNFGYFFRREEKAIKTVKRALEIVAEKGGLFGEQTGSIQGLLEGKDE